LFVRFSSSTAFSTWQPKNPRQTLGDKLVCILKLATLPRKPHVEEASIQRLENKQLRNT
jgi:hypothetical protein